MPAQGGFTSREGAFTHLGFTSDGRALTYDATMFEFWLDGERTAFSDVQMLDTRNWMRWRAPQLREWFRRIVPSDLDACNKRAHAQAGMSGQVRRSASSAPQTRAAGAAAQAPAVAAAGPVARGDGRVRAAEDSHLEYRTTDASVASVDDRGVVRVVGAGTADIYAWRVRDGQIGPELRVATIVSDGAAGKKAGQMPRRQPPNKSAQRAAAPLEGVSAEPMRKAVTSFQGAPIGLADIATAPYEAATEEEAAAKAAPFGKAGGSGKAAEASFQKPEKTSKAKKRIKRKKHRQAPPADAALERGALGPGITQDSLEPSPVERPSREQRNEALSGWSLPGFARGEDGYATWNVR